MGWVLQSISLRFIGVNHNVEILVKIRLILSKDLVIIFMYLLNIRSISSLPTSIFLDVKLSVLLLRKRVYESLSGFYMTFPVESTTFRFVILLYIHAVVQQEYLSSKVIDISSDNSIGYII